MPAPVHGGQLPGSLRTSITARWRRGGGGHGENYDDDNDDDDGDKERDADAFLRHEGGQSRRLVISRVFAIAFVTICFWCCSWRW